MTYLYLWLALQLPVGVVLGKFLKAQVQHEA